MDHGLLTNMLDMLDDVRQVAWLTYISFAVPLAIICVCTMIAAKRRALSAVADKPECQRSYATDMDPNEVFRVVLEYAVRSRYRIDHIDQANRHLILSDAPLPITYGFFYPLYVSADGNGRAIVEVGAVSKLSPLFPKSDRHREWCFNGVKAAIMLHEMRRN